METKEILSFGKDIIAKEVVEIQRMQERLNDQFVAVIKEILNCKGKVVVIGVGKNAPIAQKMVATLNSTGTIAQFLHAGEALHGDVGLVQTDDVCIILSKSGNTAEIKASFPSIKSLCKCTIAISGNRDSFLAHQADYNLDVAVQMEAGPIALAPTSSTTVQLVLCDAIAMTVKKLKNFDNNDFGKYHPGGSLGKQLLLKVKDMIDSSQKPQVELNATIPEVIDSLSSGRYGITVVMDNGTIVGVVTDGDLRRMLEKYSDFSNLHAKDIASLNPKTIDENTLATKALKMINDHKIGQLVVVDAQDTYKGIVDFHGLTNEGISAE